MENNIYQLIKKLAEREKIAESEVVEMLSLVFQKFYREKEGENAELKVILDKKKEEILFYRSYQIVKEIKDPSKEITETSEILHTNKGKKENDHFLVPINLEKISNIELVIKEFHSLLAMNQRKKWANDFRSLQGTIVEGNVQVVKQDFCLVKLNQEALGFWGRDEWLPRERPEVGQNLRFLLKKVEENQIILTRRDDIFLQKLFETEVPEIAEGIIIIKDILRLPGFISKVIFESKDPYLKASGTCIGKGGERIRNVIKDMARERIDIVEWRERKNELIANLFAPVKVVSVSLLPRDDCFLVVVPQVQISLALMQEGQLIKLISDYLGKKITVKSLEEIEKEDMAINWNGIFKSFEEYKKWKEMHAQR